MLELIIESESVETKKNNVIQISSEFMKYILLIDNLIEFDITKQIEPTLELNFKGKEKATANILLKSGEYLSNIPFKGRRKELL